MKEFNRETFKDMPWKNGRGMTTEIFREEFDGQLVFRLSRAIISEKGPFSLFEGMKRHLVLLEGGGCNLERADQKIELLNENIFEFNGSEPWEADPIHGPVIDFNVFSMKSFYRCQVSWIQDQMVSNSLGHETYLYSYELDKLIILNQKENYFAQGKMIMIKKEKVP